MHPFKSIFPGPLRSGIRVLYKIIQGFVTNPDPDTPFLAKQRNIMKTNKV
jgi:hypothetical protein